MSYVDKFYIIYIEPLPFGFKNDLAAMKIIQPTPEGGGHVEDKFLFVKSDDDIKRMWGIVESFKYCTNALINLQKTRLLGLEPCKAKKPLIL